MGLLAPWFLGQTYFFRLTTDFYQTHTVRTSVNERFALCTVEHMKRAKKLNIFIIIIPKLTILLTIKECTIMMPNLSRFHIVIWLLIMCPSRGVK